MNALYWFQSIWAINSDRPARYSIGDSKLLHSLRRMYYALTSGAGSKTSTTWLLMTSMYENISSTKILFQIIVHLMTRHVIKWAKGNEPGI